jgi:hypothetical protein
LASSGSGRRWPKPSAEMNQGNPMHDDACVVPPIPLRVPLS